MKLVLVLLGVVLTFAMASADLESEWKDFKIKFNRTYADEKEEQERKQIFTETFHQITEHNKKYDEGSVSYKQGINQFADKTKEELRKTNLGLITLPRDN